VEVAVFPGGMLRCAHQGAGLESALGFIRRGFTSLSSLGVIKADYLLTLPNTATNSGGCNSRHLGLRRHSLSEVGRRSAPPFAGHPATDGQQEHNTRARSEDQVEVGITGAGGIVCGGGFRG